LVDDHIIKYADDGSTVTVIVGDCEWRHAGSGAAGRRCGVRPDPVDQSPYPGIVGRHPVPWGTAPVTVVRPVTVRGQYPPVPADLAEGHPQRVPAAAGLAVPATAVGVPVRPGD